jgi:hypothetical protein
MGSSPVFNEVIGVSFDTSAFQESLKTLRDLWDQTLKEMGSASPSLGIANSDALVEAFAKTGDQIKGLAESYGSAVEGLTSKLSEAISSQTAAIDAALEETAANAKRTAAEVESSGFGQAFKQGFANTLDPESLGNLAGIQVAWTGIGAAIGLASKAVEEVDILFKSGVDYARQLEQNAAKLQGVIATNVKLSQDFEENYKLAGESAILLQKQFEDASIKYGIGVTTLERGFKQLVDGGGVSLVRNLQEAQQLSVSFGVSLQAAGKDADSTRAILGELPKMLAGIEKPTSFILETLGLTTKQWDAILAKAKTHHDLLDQLSPLMANYAKVAEDAATRQAPLMESIGLQLKRIMADAEAAPFKEWTHLLQEVKGFLDEDHASLSATVSTIIEGAESLGKLVASVVELGAALTPVHGSFHDIWLNILAMVEGVTTLNNGLTTLSNILTRFSSIKAGESFKEQWRDATEYAKQQVKSFNDAFDESAKRLYAADKGHAYVNPNGNNFQSYMAGEGAYVPGSNGPLTDTPGTGSKTPANLAKPKYDNSALKDLEKQYADESALSKQQYETEIQQNNTLLAERKKSIQETDAANAKAAQDEYLRQMRIIDVVRERSKLLSNVKPDAVRGFNESLDTKSTNLQTQEQQRVSDDNIRSIKATLTAQDQADSEAIASVRKLTDEKIAEIKRAEQAGLVSNRTMIASTELYTVAARNSLNQLYDAEIARAGADTQRVNQLTALKLQSEEAYTAKLKELASQRVDAQLKEFDAQQNAALRQAALERDRVVAANSGRRNSNNPNIAAQHAVNATQAELAYAKAVVASANAELLEAQNAGKAGDALSSKKNQLAAAQAAEIAAQTKANEARQQQVDQSPEGAAIANVGNSLSDFKDDFSSSIENFGEAINVFHGSVNNIIQAVEKGGILGGAGASASAAGGVVSSLSKSLGSAFQSFAAVGGPMLSAVGTLFSAISGIFEQEAQDIANTIEKNLQNAQNAYSNQTATLVQTLQAVQQQRQDAISELSGIKGGQDQLDKLLPQIDQEIAQLKLQIKEAMLTFTNSLQDLQLDNSALSAAFDKWQQINSQVQAYLSAGGDVAAANEYISDSLRAMKEAAGDALNQGYQTAIQDAINLNGLIQQRMQMEQQEAETEFNTINGDALERRGTKAIDEGTRLQQEKAQYQQQMDSLNSEIDLTQQKVTLEGQEFNLAQSLAQLRETSNSLQIEQLQEQLQIVQAQKDIYNGITQGSNGQYTASTSLMNEIGVVNINVTAGGTPGDDSAASPNDVADAVKGVLDNWSRYGFGSTISKT